MKSPYSLEVMGQHPMQNDCHLAQAEKMQKEIVTTANELPTNPARVAYQLVEKIYT